MARSIVSHGLDPRSLSDIPKHQVATKHPRTIEFSDELEFYIPSGLRKFAWADLSQSLRKGPKLTSSMEMTASSYSIDHPNNLCSGVILVASVQTAQLRGNSDLKDNLSLTSFVRQPVREVPSKSHSSNLKGKSRDHWDLNLILVQTSLKYTNLTIWYPRLSLSDGLSVFRETMKAHIMIYLEMPWSRNHCRDTNDENPSPWLIKVLRLLMLGLSLSQCGSAQTSTLKSQQSRKISSSKSSSDVSSGSSGQKRCRHNLEPNEDEDGSEEEDDRPPDKRPRQLPLIRRFACPYHRANPIKYPRGACNGKGFEDIHRLK